MENNIQYYENWLKGVQEAERHYAPENQSKLSIEAVLEILRLIRS